MRKGMVAVINFEGRFNQLAARYVRKHGVYCELFPFDVKASELSAHSVSGIILAGGEGAADNLPDPEIFNLGVPVLALGYGMRAALKVLGAQVSENPSEFKPSETALKKSALFAGLDSIRALTDVNNPITSLPKELFVTAGTDKDIRAAEDPAQKLYFAAFQLEGAGEAGQTVIANFLQLTQSEKKWSMAAYADEYIKELREKAGQKRILLALSGGVDSAVCASLIARAVGKQLYCIFVDHGLMRKNEGDSVSRAFSKGFDMNFIRVDAEARFLERLRGITDPERKRKIIGEEFIRVFEEEAKKLGAMDFFVQGTIYPDIIESGNKLSKGVKSHHNVGGLPDHIEFKELLEPLKLLFKDEVRELGRVLGLPAEITKRQPFPGPGLAVRCLGEITKEKLDVLREADAIFRAEVDAGSGFDKPDQYFAVLTNMRSVGVRNDERTYDYTVALRAVRTQDFMSAEFCEIPYSVLRAASARICRECKNVSRVVYDITSKPPATIEYE